MLHLSDTLYDPQIRILPTDSHELTVQYTWIVLSTNRLVTCQWILPTSFRIFLQIPLWIVSTFALSAADFVGLTSREDAWLSAGWECLSTRIVRRCFVVSIASTPTFNAIKVLLSVPRSCFYSFTHLSKVALTPKSKQTLESGLEIKLQLPFLLVLCSIRFGGRLIPYDELPMSTEIVANSR